MGFTAKRLLAHGVAVSIMVVATPAQAHLGGQLTLPEFEGPVGIHVVSPSDSVTFQWFDDNEDPTGILDFRYHGTPAPPAIVPDDKYLDGLPIGSVALTDESNALVWEFADVPTGSWWAYSQTVDEGMCTGIAYLPALFVVRPEGEPMPLGGLFTSPSEHRTAEPSVTFELEAVADTAPTVRLAAGILWPAKADGTSAEYCVVTQMSYEMKEVLVEDAPMVADGDRWRFSYAWDTTGLDPEWYAVEATLTTDDGQEAFFYAPKLVEVQATIPVPPDPDAVADTSSPADGVESDLPAPDLGPEHDSDDDHGHDAEDEDTAQPAPAASGSGGGCRGGGGGGAPLMALLGLLFLAGASRRRRV
jgi:hypothetical protein